MRFATFSRGGDPEVGAVWPAEGIIRPLRDGALAFSGDMSTLVESYECLSVDLVSRGPTLKLSEVKLLAPILTPRRNVFCVGKNYQEHAKEFSQSGFDASSAEPPEVPIIFTKSSGSVIGPLANISSHSELTQGLDYEAELGVVIGRSGRAISRDSALSHVWGYTIINDVTARDLQRRHQQWFIGKSLDTFCPMGPWVVTADEIDPQRLDISCKVNEELRQHASTGDMIFDVATLIEVISKGLTLRSADIIATGTPAGVGAGFKPPRFLKRDDIVSITIEKIGTLTNRVA
jgi:2-keto-4-pentenoate hydratase/2-oxohepta-3-ene-1,7-dioic acid hydratase in catechol pathway